jgi:PAS domain-containing protein
LPAANKPQTYEAEYRVRTLAGDWRWVLSRGRVAEVNARGEPAAVIGLTIDIDDRKRAQLALQNSEHQLSLAVWGGAVGLWDWDFFNDRCRWLNDWCQTHDFDECASPDHGVRWKANMHPDDRRRVDTIDDEFSAGGSDSYEYEYRLRTRQGEWRWLLERGRIAARASDGRATRVVGVCIDITIGKHNERKLREYQERYFAVVQRIPGYVFELRPEPDGQATVSWASDGLEKVFGVDLKTYRELGGWRKFGLAEDYERNVENRRALLASAEYSRRASLVARFLHAVPGPKQRQGRHDSGCRS